MDNSMLSIKVFEKKFLSLVSSNYFDAGLKLSKDHLAK